MYNYSPIVKIQVLTITIATVAHLCTYVLLCSYVRAVHSYGVGVAYAGASPQGFLLLELTMKLQTLV